MKQGLVVFMLGALLFGCGGAAPEGKHDPSDSKSAAALRATRRAYDGAPPVIPHPDIDGTCMTCHGKQRIEVPGLGYSPEFPHGKTLGLSDEARGTQCHVWKRTDDLFVANSFEGVKQDLRRGKRLNPLSPPVIPHRVFMRENCLACHGGTAAREEIRCSHPERERCTQCHLEQTTPTLFGEEC